MAPSPVVARLELSRRFLARRKELGVDVKTITTSLGFTRNYWSAVENSRTLIAEDKLRQLFEVLHFDETAQAELLALREYSRKKGWWDDQPVLDDEQKRFYGMEAGADEIRYYDGHLIPGILQIEEYAKAVIGVHPVISAVDVDRQAAVRAERQRHLFDTSKPSLSILIGEAALRQQVAGAKIQSTQLRFVLELATSDASQIEVRVLPFDRNPGVIASSSTLTFFRYRSPHLSDIAWQEAVRSLGIIDAEHEIFRQLELAWTDGFNRSLSTVDSAEMIAEVATTFE